MTTPTDQTAALIKQLRDALAHAANVLGLNGRYEAAARTRSALAAIDALPAPSGEPSDWRQALASLLSSGVGVETLRKLADGQGTNTDDGRAWLRAAALVTSPQAAPAPQAERVHELEQVLRAVQQELQRVAKAGDNFPDGFDSRLCRWVDDALAGTPQAAPAPQAALPPAAAAPVQPLTESQKHAMWVAATIEPCTHWHCYRRGVIDAERAHGITATPAKEPGHE